MKLRQHIKIFSTRYKVESFKLGLLCEMYTSLDELNQDETESKFYRQCVAHADRMYEAVKSDRTDFTEAVKDIFEEFNLTRHEVAKLIVLFWEQCEPTTKRIQKQLKINAKKVARMTDKAYLAKKSDSELLEVLGKIFSNS